MGRDSKGPAKVLPVAKKAAEAVADRRKRYEESRRANQPEVGDFDLCTDDVAKAQELQESGDYTGPHIWRGSDRVKRYGFNKTKGGAK